MAFAPCRRENVGRQLIGGTGRYDTIEGIDERRPDTVTASTLIVVLKDKDARDAVVTALVPHGGRALLR